MQCSAAAVWGAGGVTAVQLPRHSLRQEVVVAGLALVSGGGAVQAVVWHPGSAADSHRAVLTRDAKIVLYNVMFGLGEVRGLALGRTGRVAAALGEMAVDMAFGPAGATAVFSLPQPTIGNAIAGTALLSSGHSIPCPALSLHRSFTALTSSPAPVPPGRDGRPA